MKKVLIPTKLDSVAADILKAHGGYEVVQDAKTPLDEQVKAHPDAYAMIVRSETVPAAVIDLAKWQNEGYSYMYAEMFPRLTREELVKQTIELQ